MNINGGSQDTIDWVNILVNDFPNSIDNQASDAMLNNQSLSASNIWAPNVEGQQLGALAAKYIVDNDLDADTVLATLDALNNDAIQKQETKTVVNDINQAIQLKLASDDDFSMDVARRESLDLAISTTSNTVTADTQQLQKEIVAAVSDQLASLHSVDDFNALTDEEQATDAAAMAALDVQADVNAEIQDPDDFATVVQMGNALTDQVVVDAETSILNRDDATIDTVVQHAANSFLNLSAVRAFMNSDDNGFNESGEQNLGYLLAEAELEGLDPESLLAQENSAFSKIA